MVLAGGSIETCVMAVFLRNWKLTAKALTVARGHKAVSLCSPNTVGKHTLGVERVVMVDYRMDGLNSTKPYDAGVVVA